MDALAELVESLPAGVVATDPATTENYRFDWSRDRGAGTPIAVVRAPSEIPPMRFYQLWHERNHTSAASRWLRQQVTAVAEALP